MTKHALPEKILLATDLSARCDRALDRAAILAGTWKSELVVVNALEQQDDFYSHDLELRLPSWRRKPDPARIVMEQLRQDILQGGIDVIAVAEQAEPTELILRTAQAHACGLIVTGIARDETLGRFGLGNTVDRLLRRTHIPLLTVRQRARAAYRNIMVATDLSDSSRHALETAASFFPEQNFDLFHAYEPLLTGMASDNRRHQDEACQVASDDCRAFLNAANIPQARKERTALRVEYGSAFDLIPQYVHDHGTDLVVLGTHGRSGLLDILIGSTARQLLPLLPCDILIVREPRAQVETA